LLRCRRGTAARSQTRSGQVSAVCFAESISSAPTLRLGQRIEGAFDASARRRLRASPQTDLCCRKTAAGTGVGGGSRILLQSRGAKPGRRRRHVPIDALDGPLAPALARAGGRTLADRKKRPRRRQAPSPPLFPLRRLA